MYLNPYSRSSVIVQYPVTGLTSIGRRTKSGFILRAMMSVQMMIQMPENKDK